MSNTGIVQLQHWLSEVITFQGNLERKVGRAERMFQLSAQEVVADTRDVSIYTRLNVYSSGYVMRLMECLSADFPILEKFLGKDVFDGFATAALMWSPSTSYSLYDLGTTFIKFLEATKPADVPGTDSSFFQLPIDIARAERARQEVQRAMGEENVIREDISALLAEDMFLCMQAYTVYVPDCVRFVELSYPVKKLMEAVNNGSETVLPAPANSWLAVGRVNYKLTFEELEEWQYLFLIACKTNPLLTDATQQAATAARLTPSQLLTKLCFVLPWFCNRGFLVVQVA